MQFTSTTIRVAVLALIIALSSAVAVPATFTVTTTADNSVTPPAGSLRQDDLLGESAFGTFGHPTRNDEWPL